MNLKPYYQKYTQEIVDKAIMKLNYKEVSELPKNEDPNYPILYIFRHGQSKDNEEMIFSGWRDSILTPVGIKQALNLAEMIKNKKIDYLYASTQIRAIDTMKYAISQNKMAKDLEIHTDSRLKERSYGDLQGTSKLELFLTDEISCNEYRRSYYKKSNNGESLEEVVKRIENFILEIIIIMKDENINVAVSCHGNSIRGFRKYFENLTPEEVTKLETPLASDYLAYNIK